MSDWSSTYKQREAERRAKWLSQEPVEYTDEKPVYDADRDTYYHNLDTLMETRWDDGDTYEDAIVFECSVEKAATPDLVEYVEERWGEEFDSDGNWPEVPQELRKKLEAIQVELHEAAPDVWYPDYKRRLVFDYSGFPEIETEKGNQ